MLWFPVNSRCYKHSDKSANSVIRKEKRITLFCFDLSGSRIPWIPRLRKEQQKALSRVCFKAQLSRHLRGKWQGDRKACVTLERLNREVTHTVMHFPQLVPSDHPQPPSPHLHEFPLPAHPCFVDAETTGWARSLSGWLRLGGPTGWRVIPRSTSEDVGRERQGRGMRQYGVLGPKLIYPPSTFPPMVRCAWPSFPPLSHVGIQLRE